MTEVRGTFAGAGGVPIQWLRCAPSAGAPRAAVLLAHGYAEHVGRYRDFIAHLGARGFAVAAIDHRGHGLSGGPRGHCGSFDELVADLRALADMAAEAWPRAPRLLFGHSLGGLLAVVYLLVHPDTVRAAAVTGPAIRVPDAAPRAVQRLALLLGRVAPRFPLGTKLDERLLARDPAVGAAYVADPLVHRRATAGFFRAVRAAQARALAEAPRLQVPLLILQGDADRIVEPSGASELAARLTCEHELVMLPGYYHELLNEPEVERARVLTLLDRWFDRWVA